MNIELYPYQQEAVDKLHNGSILCGIPGSGKSVTALSYYNKVASKKNLYIITTARKRDTFEWESDMARFDMSTNKKLDKNHREIHVDSWNNIGKYKNIKDSFFIFDEQRVVGYGKWAKSFITIAKHNEWIMLSATPGDNWSDYMAVFIANGFFKDKYDFTRKHIVYKQYRKYPVIDYYTNELPLYRMRNYILVPMKYEHKTIEHIEKIKCPYNRVLYKDLTKRRWDNETDSPITNISELCYLLRKVCNSDPSRKEIIEGILLQHPKIIIFYNYDYELEILRTINVPKAEWNGHKHEPIPNTDTWIYLVQYAAGAEGWNCTETDTMVFYSQTYSYKLQTQAQGRINRLNTPFTDLYYYNLTSTSSIDIAINKALKNKENFNERMFASQ